MQCSLGWFGVVAVLVVVVRVSPFHIRRRCAHDLIFYWNSTVMSGDARTCASKKNRNSKTTDHPLLDTLLVHTQLL